MAKENTTAQPKAPWTKIFSAFKVALDMKKMVLAAAGILLMWVGWWILSFAFYSARTMPPYVVKNEQQDAAVVRAEWDNFKAQRRAWNLIHELAGPPGAVVRVDAGDVAITRDEYILLKTWHDGNKRGLERISVVEKDKVFVLEVPELKSATFTLTPDNDAAKTDLPKLKDKNLKLISLVILDGVNRVIKIDGVQLKVEGPFEKLSAYRKEALSLQEIEDQAKLAKAVAAFENFKTHLVAPKAKVCGLMRVDPWHENRGANPYLIVAEAVKTRGDSLVSNGQFFTTFVRDDVPVLLEPLFKFLMPVVYLFDSRAGAWERLYLILAMLWTLVIWGFFGAAICRIAAVQVARNERITLRDAVQFARERCVSYCGLCSCLLGWVSGALLMIFGLDEWIHRLIGPAAWLIF